MGDNLWPLKSSSISERELLSVSGITTRRGLATIGLAVILGGITAIMTRPPLCTVDTLARTVLFLTRFTDVVVPAVT